MSFFDNLGQKLNDVGQTTIKKTKDLADTAKMNLEISEEERKISDAHEQIGKWYAAKYRMQADPEIQNWMDAIFASEAKIKACRDNLGQIKGETSCPQCGASIAADAQFCPNCGQKIVPQQPAQDVTPQPVKDDSTGGGTNTGRSRTVTAGRDTGSSIRFDRCTCTGERAADRFQWIWKRRNE